MRIESIEIKNFKVIRSLRLDNVPSLAVIAGPNGSGKTALFDALRVFKEAIATYSVQSQGPVYVQTLLSQLSPVITVGEEEAEITVSIRVSDTERRAIELPAEHPGLLTAKVAIRQQGIQQQESANLMNTYDLSPHHIQLLLGGYRSGGEIGMIDHIGPDRRFVASAVTGVQFSPQNEEMELRRLVLESTDKFATLTQDLVMMRFLDMQERELSVQEPKRYIEGVREIFRHFLPDQEFVDVRIPPNFSGLPEIIVRSRGVEHDINQLSSGQREILMTYTHLERLRPTGSIILFDEPELHLHPTLQRRVIAHLRRLIDLGNNQILVITQSDAVVDTTEYESLFAMTGQGDPAIERVTERAERIGLLQHLGANVGLQLTSPRILFVEGESDEELLPLFFGIVPAEISVVSTGGKSNLMRLTEAAMRLLEEAVVEGQFYLVRDRDIEDYQGDIDDLQEKYKGSFFAWDRYHIENYLLDDEAIYQVLADDPDVPTPASAAEVERQLRDLAEERKENVLAKYLEARFNPEFRKRLRINVPEGVQASLLKATEARLKRIVQLLDNKEVERVYIEVSTELEERWESDWKRLCIGRDVLEAFHKAYVRRYLGYEVFRNRVARKIQELNRVPQAIEEVIYNVTAGL